MTLCSQILNKVLGTLNNAALNDIYSNITTILLGAHFKAYRLTVHNCTIVLCSSTFFHITRFPHYTQETSRGKLWRNTI